MLIKVGEIDKVGDLTTGGEHRIFTRSLACCSSNRKRISHTEMVRVSGGGDDLSR